MIASACENRVPSECKMFPGVVDMSSYLRYYVQYLRSGIGIDAWWHCAVVNLRYDGQHKRVPLSCLHRQCWIVGVNGSLEHRVRVPSVIQFIRAGWNAQWLKKQSYNFLRSDWPVYTRCLMYVDEDGLPELPGRRCQRILLGCNGQGTTRFSSQRILIPSLNLRNVHTQKEALVIKFGYLVRERSFCMKLPGVCRWTAGLLYSRLRYSVRILWLTASLGS